MTRFPKSIRWRLQLWYGLLLVAVLCAFGFSAFHLEKTRRFRKLDGDLQARLAALVNALRAAPERGAGNRPPPPYLRASPALAGLFNDAEGFYYAVWMQGEKPIAQSTNAPDDISKPEPREGASRMRGATHEAFLFAAPVNCALVGRSTGEDAAELNGFALRLALAGAAVLAVAMLMGWWIVTRALRPVEAIGDTALKIAAGDLSRRISTADTESELGKLAGVLNSTFARLESVFAQQAQFTADAAHELRTPVTVLLTQIQSTLTREREPADYRETLAACERAAQRMRRLIESLLELTRMDAGQEPIHRQSCDLAGIAAECATLVKPLAEERGITITTKLESAPCTMDAGRISQVITNLLTNAIEYNEPDGTAEVCTSLESGHAILTVRNSGPGIPAADLPHIFERFRRADRSRTGNHCGLGLAISKAIVDAHGGTIHAISEIGKGATFVVRLPV